LGDLIVTENIMKAMIVREFGAASEIEMADVDATEPRIGEIVVEIRAAGVNPLDAVVRAGYGKGVIPVALPLILGHDFAGIVSEIGESCNRFKVGDEVYGYTFPNVLCWGTYAERIVLPELWVGKKPQSIDFGEAAAFPIPALTSIQLLDDWAKMRSGEVILIHGAAGGVGSFAVQLAKHRGLTVIGTASPRNHDYLRALGCDDVIDYNTQDFRDVVKRQYPDGIDIVLFTLSIVDNDFKYGEKTLFDSVDVLKGAGKLGSGSRLASIVNMADQKPELIRRGVNFKYISGRPHGTQLDMLSELIDAGAIRPPKITRMPLSEARQAHELIETKHVAGKIVLDV
jgi:NADPH:quinone reductase-like Zn-dependent oxidoreductase